MRPLAILLLFIFVQKTLENDTGNGTKNTTDSDATMQPNTTAPETITTIVATNTTTVTDFTMESRSISKATTETVNKDSNSKIAKIFMIALAGSVLVGFIMSAIMLYGCWSRKRKRAQDQPINVYESLQPKDLVYESTEDADQYEAFDQAFPHPGSTYAMSANEVDPESISRSINKPSIKQTSINQAQVKQ